MLRLSDIMTRHVVVATPEMTLREAADVFAAHHISGAPVVSGMHVVGVVSAADILELAASERTAAHPSGAQPRDMEWTEPPGDEKPESESAPTGSYFNDLWATASDDVTERVDHPGGAEVDVLDEHTVDEIMSRPPVALSPHDDVLAAANLMREKAIHRVIVVENGDLVGIVTTLDIVRAVADRKLTSRTYVFDRAPALDDVNAGQRRELES
jgi:CBS domain-containing protein